MPLSFLTSSEQVRVGGPYLLNRHLLHPHPAPSLALFYICMLLCFDLRQLCEVGVNPTVRYLCTLWKFLFVFQNKGGSGLCPPWVEMT